MTDKRRQREPGWGHYCTRPRPRPAQERKGSDPQKSRDSWSNLEGSTPLTRYVLNPSRARTTSGPQPPNTGVLRNPQCTPGPPIWRSSRPGGLLGHRGAKKALGWALCTASGHRPRSLTGQPQHRPLQATVLGGNRQV